MLFLNYLSLAMTQCTYSRPQQKLSILRIVIDSIPPSTTLWRSNTLRWLPRATAFLEVKWRFSGFFFFFFFCPSPRACFLCCFYLLLSRRTNVGERSTVMMDGGREMMMEDDDDDDVYDECGGELSE